MKSYLKYGVIYGILSSVLCMVYFYVTLSLGMNPLGGGKAISYFLMLGVFFLLLHNFRVKEKNGILHFHQGFFVVLVEHLVSCLLYTLFIWLSLQYFNSGLLLKHKKESTIFLNFIKPDLIRSIGEDGFRKGLEDIRSMTPLSLAFDEFKKRFAILLFFALIATFIMRRSPNTFTAK